MTHNNTGALTAGHLQRVHKRKLFLERKVETTHLSTNKEVALRYKTGRGNFEEEEKKSQSCTKGSRCGFDSGKVTLAAEEQIETSAGEIECCSLTGDL